MIFVCGSINADLCFEVERCPVAGETLTSKQFRIVAGGKGANQAVAAARDGAEVSMIGAVGDDALAHTALANLVETGVDLSQVRHINGATGCAAIIVENNGENRIILDPGANGAVTAGMMDLAPISRGSCLLLQMEIPVATTVAIIDAVSAKGVKIILNLAPAATLPRATLEKLDILIVNETEADFLAAELGTANDAASLAQELGIDVVRTLGAGGAEVFTEGMLVAVSGLPVDVVDTTAAGDCFIGVLAAEIDREHSLAAAMQRAVGASALACTLPGSQSSLPCGSDINRFLAKSAV